MREEAHRTTPRQPPWSGPSIRETIAAVNDTAILYEVAS
jgi:hypothetical protein